MKQLKNWKMYFEDDEGNTHELEFSNMALEYNEPTTAIDSVSSVEATFHLEFTPLGGYFLYGWGFQTPMHGIN